MSISTYSELTTAVLGWADRSTDSAALAQIDNFIALAETGFNLRLRLRQMETQTSVTPDASGFCAIPEDMLEWRRLTYTGNPRRDLEFVEPRSFEYAYPDRPSDNPRTFTMEAGYIKICPISTTALDFVYFAKIPALTSGSPTNWLLTAYPNIYLWGCLAQLAAWAKDDAGTQSYHAAMEAAIQAAQRQETMLRGPSSIRASTVTP